MWRCGTATVAERSVHNHTSAFLVMGSEKSALIDTGHPAAWGETLRVLEAALDGRRLDWVIPTHPELPHSGNLARLLDRWPDAEVTGDVADYHLIFPAHTHRLRSLERGQSLDLGGHELVILDAPIRDLPSTTWVYERSQQILFSSDGLGYTHYPPNDGDAVHLPNECSFFSSELPKPPDVVHTGYLTRSALSWTRYVDMEPVFERVFEIMREYPVRLVAPAHGNVIDVQADVMPVIQEAHRLAYEGLLPVAEA
jgi:Metallo-beta-lactamase superfamily